MKSAAMLAVTARTESLEIHSIPNQAAITGATALKTIQKIIALPTKPRIVVDHEAADNSVDLCGGASLVSGSKSFCILPLSEAVLMFGGLSTLTNWGCIVHSIGSPSPRHANSSKRKTKAESSSLLMFTMRGPDVPKNTAATLTET
jgi:hypothetical protein